MLILKNICFISEEEVFPKYKEGIFKDVSLEDEILPEEIEGFEILNFRNFSRNITQNYQECSVSNLDYNQKLIPLLGYLPERQTNGKVFLATWYDAISPSYIFCYDLPYPYKADKMMQNGYSKSIYNTNRYYNFKIKEPMVQSIEPNLGSFRGRTRVVIKVENFREGANVFLGGIQAKNIQVIDSETIYATMLAHKPCNDYLNDISVSLYELSYKMMRQPLIMGQEHIRLGNRVEDFYATSAIGSARFTNGCLVNVVVAHPNPN